MAEAKPKDDGETKWNARAALGVVTVIASTFFATTFAWYLNNDTAIVNELKATVAENARTMNSEDKALRERIATVEANQTALLASNIRIEAALKEHREETRQYFDKLEAKMDRVVAVAQLEGVAVRSPTFNNMNQVRIEQVPQHLSILSEQFREILAREPVYGPPQLRFTKGPTDGL